MSLSAYSISNFTAGASATIGLNPSSTASVFDCSTVDATIKSWPTSFNFSSAPTRSLAAATVKWTTAGLLGVSNTTSNVAQMVQYGGGPKGNDSLLSLYVAKAAVGAITSPTLEFAFYTADATPALIPVTATSVNSGAPNPWTLTGSDSDSTLTVTRATVGSVAIATVLVPAEVNIGYMRVIDRSTSPPNALALQAVQFSTVVPGPPPPVAMTLVEPVVYAASTQLDVSSAAGYMQDPLATPSPGTVVTINSASLCSAEWMVQGWGETNSGHCMTGSVSCTVATNTASVSAFGVYASMSPSGGSPSPTLTLTFAVGGTGSTNTTLAFPAVNVITDGVAVYAAGGNGTVSISYTGTSTMVAAIRFTLATPVQLMTVTTSETNPVPVFGIQAVAATSTAGIVPAACFDGSTLVYCHGGESDGDGRALETLVGGGVFKLQGLRAGTLEPCVVPVRVFVTRDNPSGSHDVGDVCPGVVVTKDHAVTLLHRPRPPDVRQPDVCVGGCTWIAGTLPEFSRTRRPTFRPLFQLVPVCAEDVNDVVRVGEGVRVPVPVRVRVRADADADAGTGTVFAELYRSPAEVLCRLNGYVPYI